ncbi:MAG: SDR family oxidoreductase [candidate division Zixibacteria bacterium]|nr:SDR family oxidoreductase [candidate division Zixibacteria bacterium]
MANTVEQARTIKISKETLPSLKELYDLTGKVALITGGAGQLGKQFAEGLAEAGAEIILTDIREPELVERQNELKDMKYKVSCYRSELTDAESVYWMFDAIRKKYSRLDILINNGGMTYFMPLEEMKPEEFEKVLDVHLKGSFMLVQQVLPFMKRNGGGSIINIGSIYGMVGADQSIYGDSGLNSSAAYAAAKGGMINFTRYLASYLGEYNIRANCISPGGFYAGQAPEFIERYCAKTPLGRMGDSYDLKGVGVFLASDASKYITGVNLPVDGGWTAR